MNKKRFLFSTKAETLKLIAPLLNLSTVPELSIYNISEWEDNSEIIISHIQENYSDSLIAIRSSSMSEDGATSSMAGAFESILNVNVTNNDELISNINNVSKQLQSDKKNQFFIQKMVDKVKISGVIMTRDIQTGSPYYVLNYDEETGRTNTVTNGGSLNKTIYIFHDASLDYIRSARIKKIIKSVKEIESICDGQAIDIEFALDEKGVFYLLQVRLISTSAKWMPGLYREVKDSLIYAYEFIKTIKKENKFNLRGNDFLIGVMPDWNPAELIGKTPKLLAESLFRYLITDSVWRESRSDMGYYNPIGRELMISILGHPFIDVRASFNSLIPQDLPDDLAEKIIDSWISNLSRHPELHDKVEFEIIQSCIDFTFEDDLERKTNGILDSDERDIFRKSLHNLTLNALDLSEHGTLTKSLSALKKLRAKQNRRTLGVGVGVGGIDTINNSMSLLEECKKYGTKPFACVARHAFIAESFLRSAVQKGAINNDRIKLFRKNLKTVASDFYKHLHEYSMDRNNNEFIREYGHLRPGTFDIESPRYADRWEQLLKMPKSETEGIDNKFVLSKHEVTALNNLLTENGLEGISAYSLFNYIEKSIVGREFGKFVLSRNVSDVLESIALWGKSIGLNRAETASLSFDTIKNLALNSRRPGFMNNVKYLIEQSELDHSIATSIKLPSIIHYPDDVFVAPLPRAMPNLFGTGIVRGTCVNITAADDWEMLLNNKIICIESADPGYDWIFATNAIALITKFGGANSHMAIRCLEVGMPAAIGCGEQLFTRIVEAGAVELNFGNGSIIPFNME